MACLLYSSIIAEFLPVPAGVRSFGCGVVMWVPVPTLMMKKLEENGTEEGFASDAASECTTTVTTALLFDCGHHEDKLLTDVFFGRC